MKRILFITLFFLSTGSVFTGVAQTGKYLKNRIMVESLYLRNLGNFGEIWSKAAGGYIGYSIAFHERNSLILRTGFISNSLKDGVEYEDASSIIIPVEIGGRYYFIDNRFMPFVQFMNGLNLIFENTNLEGEKEDKTLAKYAWQIGFGITINMMENLNIDIGANYQSNFYEKEAMNTGFEYTLGFGLALGE